MQIGMLGNIEPRKGVLEFVEHFGKMNLPEIKLNIAGKAKDATYYGKIKRHIVENNLESKITIEGYVKDLNDWYNSNDCIISNSVYEGLKLQLLKELLRDVGQSVKIGMVLRKLSMKKDYLQILMN